MLGAMRPSTTVPLLASAGVAALLLTACGGQTRALTHPDPAGGTIQLPPKPHRSIEQLCWQFRHQVVPNARSGGTSYWSVRQETAAEIAQLGRTIPPWNAYPPTTRLALCGATADRIDDLAGLLVTSSNGAFRARAVVDWHGRWAPALGLSLED
jgi:hypothetical protein